MDTVLPSDNSDRDSKGLFKPGHSIKSPGRPRGPRAVLVDEFIKDMLDVWQDDGKEALQTLAKTDPAAFVRAAVSLVPKEAKLEVESLRTFVVSLVGSQEPQADEPDVIDGEATALLEEPAEATTEPLKASNGYAARS